VEPLRFLGVPASGLPRRAEELDTPVSPTPGLARVVHGDRDGLVRAEMARVPGARLREPDDVEFAAPSKVGRIDVSAAFGVTVAMAQKVDASSSCRAIVASRAAARGRCDRSIAIGLRRMNPDAVPCWECRAVSCPVDGRRCDSVTPRPPVGSEGPAHGCRFGVQAFGDFGDVMGLNLFG
jgi:hypothetical protein